VAIHAFHAFPPYAKLEKDTPKKLLGQAYKVGLNWPNLEARNNVPWPIILESKPNIWPKRKDFATEFT